MLDKSINACFRKIRVKEKFNKTNIDTLMEEKKMILKQNKLSIEDEKKVEEIEKLITHEIAEKEFNKLKEVVGDFDSEPNNNMWRELRKAYPKEHKPLPTGVKDIKGKVITNPKEKEKVTIEHFKHRMRKRKYMVNVEELANMSEVLFHERLK